MGQFRQFLCLVELPVADQRGFVAVGNGLLQSGDIIKGLFLGSKTTLGAGLRALHAGIVDVITEHNAGTPVFAIFEHRAGAVGAALGASLALRSLLLFAAVVAV